MSYEFSALNLIFYFELEFEFEFDSPFEGGKGDVFNGTNTKNSELWIMNHLEPDFLF